MPPTLKKLEGHIAFGLSVCECVHLLMFESISARAFIFGILVGAEQ